MFKQSSRAGTSAAQDSDEHRQPLLDPDENRDHAPHTLFTAGDDSDDELEDTSALVTPKTARGTHSVSFSDEVQVRILAPNLRSTTSSRETRKWYSVHPCGSHTLPHSRIRTGLGRSR